MLRVGFQLLFSLLLLNVFTSLAAAQDIIVDTKTKAPEIKEDANKEVADGMTDLSGPSNASPKNVERLEVTGSYIKRIDVEGPSPLVTIDAEMFKKTGTNTVNDLIRENPLFEASTDEGPRSGYFRFHGQHAGNTLVLLNGLRIPKMGAPGRDFFNGVRGIPTNVIEKVDILKDGSSALYGSDAMAGVINFITKKDYDGAEFALQTTVPETGFGLEQNYSATFGKNYSRGNWLTSIQYLQQDAYGEADIGSQAPSNSVSSRNSYYEITENINGGGTSNTAFDTNRPQCGSADNPRPCPVDTVALDRIRTPKQNLGALLTGRVDLSPDLNASALVMYNRQQKSYREYTTINLDPSQPGGLSLNLNSLGLRPRGTLSENSTGDANAYIAPGDALGARESNLLEDSYTVQGRVEKFFGDTWSWSLEGTGGYQTETTRYTNGVVSTPAVKEIVESGSLNLSDMDPTVLSTALRNPREEYNSQMVASRFFVTGELGDFQDIWGAGGAIAIAAGTGTQWEASADNNDALLTNNTLNINRPPNLQGSRSVQSAFAELSAFPLESVELSLAGRYDNYSDFGDTFNPKFAVAIRPSKSILLRSSWGTNFHAPSVRNLITPPNTTREFFVDQSKCIGVNNCRESRLPYQVTRYTDPNLGPETSIHYNFGSVIQPNKNWTFTIDQWNFQGANTIAKKFGDEWTLFESRLDATALEALGASVTRDADGNLLSMRVPEVINMGERTIRGLDLKVNFDQKVQVFGMPLNLSLSSNHSHFLQYRTLSNALLPVENRGDLEWRNTTALNVGAGRSSYRLAARTTAGDTRQGNPGLPTWTEYDLIYRVGLSWGGTLSAGVKNMLNSRPPVNLQGNGIFYGSANDAFSPLRRRFFVGYSQSL